MDLYNLAKVGKSVLLYLIYDYVLCFLCAKKFESLICY